MMRLFDENRFFFTETTFFKTRMKTSVFASCLTSGPSSGILAAILAKK